MKRSLIIVAALGLLPKVDGFTSITVRTSRRMRVRDSDGITTSIYCVESTKLLEDFVPPKPSKKCITKQQQQQHNHNNDDFLNDLHLPRGLKHALIQNTQHVFSKRIWIVDNSGSMKMMDGHEILQSAEHGKKKKKHDIKQNGSSSSSSTGAAVSVSSSSSPLTTRWAEVQETVNCHAQLSSVLGVPTDFRLLNPPSAGGPQNFRVGYHNQNIPVPVPFLGRNHKSDCHRANKIMKRIQPTGKTPLHTAVAEIRTEVIKMLPQLRTDGMKVAIVICTDGCNHDYKNVNHDGTIPSEPQLNEELRAALESLQGLPVCVVIRLCTDYGQIVDFYNDLDEQLGELSFLDVLDDYQAEASEVYSHNPWLNYALVLHRLREMGMQGSSALFDLLDERPFTRDEIRDFCALLFGTDLLPDPWYDWENFLAEVDRLQQREEYHWNPQKEVMAPWIDMEELALQQ
ncbi:hypothetical protein IV203_030753 [Nitzschia inconspicua]|uniref:Uncharacterized protein n=1 Tax=Nitzschia inconspicua TaxID=303405 RepID=A0A9K3LU88_9STRA|nr:hypothetical protein IV203_030753 [Nitzschia inconspicua]